jgi:hypothetical protein
MSDLLKEAIADAKAIREVAIENAKATLAESFAPKIKQMVSEGLNEEELFEEDDMEMETEGKYGKDEEDTMDEEFVIEGEDEDEDDAPKEAPVMKDEESVDEGEDMESDDELDEILRELEMYEAEEAEGDEEMMEGEDEEGGLYEEEEEAPTAKKSDLEEFIREMIAEMEDEEEMKTEGEDEDMEAMKEEMAEKEEELQEAYRTIKFLRKKINESLLINSKLLYSGKLFRAYNLDESQKVSILESFDRATTIRETKLLYASLATTLNEIKSKVNSKSVRLKESRASKATLNSTKPSKQVLEENKMVSRLQQLAGIIK